MKRWIVGTLVTLILCIDTCEASAATKRLTIHPSWVEVPRDENETVKQDGTFAGGKIRFIRRSLPSGAQWDQVLIRLNDATLCACIADSDDDIDMMCGKQERHFRVHRYGGGLEIELVVDVPDEPAKEATPKAKVRL